MSASTCAECCRTRTRSEATGPVLFGRNGRVDLLLAAALTFEAALVLVLVSLLVVVVGGGAARQGFFVHGVEHSGATFDSGDVVCEGVSLDHLGHGAYRGVEGREHVDALRRELISFATAPSVLLPLLHLLQE